MTTNHVKRPLVSRKKRFSVSGREGRLADPQSASNRWTFRTLGFQSPPVHYGDTEMALRDELERKTRHRSPSPHSCRPGRAKQPPGRGQQRTVGVDKDAQDLEVGKTKIPNLRLRSRQVDGDRTWLFASLISLLAIVSPTFFAVPNHIGGVDVFLAYGIYNGI